MACKIWLLAKMIDHVLMGFGAVDAEFCGSQAKGIGEHFFEVTFQSDGLSCGSSCGDLLIPRQQIDALEQWYLGRSVSSSWSSSLMTVGARVMNLLRLRRRVFSAREDG